MLLDKALLYRVMLKDFSQSKGITGFLDALSPLEKNEAMSFYGQAGHEMFVFDWHYGLSKLKTEGSIFLSNLPKIAEDSTDRFMQSLVTQITTDNPRKAYCAISIPPSGRNPHANGHAVALVIDREKKQITYQDPHGTPPPNYLVSALQKDFRDYEQIHLNIPQQKDIYSCALITTMNLVAMAQGTAVDPAIDEKLWGLRRAHAPRFLILQKEAVERSRKQTLERLQNNGEIERSKFGGIIITTNNQENLNSADELLAAIDKRDPTHPRLSSSLQLLIRLTDM